MKRIKPSSNQQQYPRNSVKSIECHKRDLVIRIADWTRQSPRTGEPAYDVEVYVGGVYDYELSDTFTLYTLKTKAAAKQSAIAFAQEQIAKLL